MPNTQLQITTQSTLRGDASVARITSQLERMEEAIQRIRKQTDNEQFPPFPFCELIAEVVNYIQLNTALHLQTRLTPVRFEMLIICEGYYCKLFMRWVCTTVDDCVIAVSGEPECLFQWQMKDGSNVGHSSRYSTTPGFQPRN